MPKCAFNCCSNRSSGPNRSLELVFYSFKDVPRPVREQWVKIVARERRDPKFIPTTSSVICAEHFEDYEKSSAKTLYSTALPTINIGPYDDTIVIEEECVGKDADLVCIIENQIPTQRSKVHQDDDIVCVIENQIRTEPKPESTGIIDIEDQLQWSLVGTSKHFDGLLNAKGPQTPPPQQQNCLVDQKSYLNDDVIILEHDDSETESEHEFKDQYSPLLKRPRKVETKEIIEEIKHESNEAKSETEKEFKDQYSQFLKTYDKNLYNYKLKNSGVPRNSRYKLDRDKDGHKLRAALMKPRNFINSMHATPKQLETITQQPRPQSENKFPATQPMLPAHEQLKTTMHQSLPTAPKQFVTTTQQPIPTQYQPTTAARKQFETVSQQTIPQSPQKFFTIHSRPPAKKQLETTTYQSLATAVEQLTTITPQSIPTPLQQLTTITQQLIPTDQFVATTQQPIPVQLIKTSQLPTPQFKTTSHLGTTPQIATAPQFAITPKLATTSHIATPVFATSSPTSTPLTVCDAASPLNGTTQLVTLVPSNFSVSGVQLSSVVLNENNTKTYYLSNILPTSTRLVFESKPIGDGIVTQQCLAFNDKSPTTNFIISGQDCKQFQPVIVKTENVSDS